MLVVGGSKGIGGAIVGAMTKAGYVLSVISRKEPEEKFENVHYWAADVTKQNSFLNVFKMILRQNGKLNHLVFSQQFRGPGDDWSGQIETSLTATKSIIELVSGDFENTRRNSMTIVSSIAGRFVAKEQSVAYHVVKAGLEHMVRYYALVLGPKGIRVNGVSPHIVLKKENKNFYLRNKEIYDLYTKVSPLGRMVTADDVASTVGFLCSSQSSGITGQSIVIDCGVSLQEHAGLARTLMSLDKIKITQKS